MVRKRPLPSRAFLTGTAEVMIAAFGTLRPLARKASLTTDPNELWGGGSTQERRRAFAAVTPMPYSRDKRRTRGAQTIYGDQ
jgi:hypothetical protein